VTIVAPSALVVDDDDSIRALVSEMLGRAGYTVRAFGTAHEAMIGAAECPPDVYVLDVRLPDVSGRDLCRALKADERTRRPVLMISAESLATDVARAFDAGCDDFLAKPFRRCELIGRVEALPRETRRPPAKDPSTTERVATIARHLLDDGYVDYEIDAWLIAVRLVAAHNQLARGPDGNISDTVV
jgi:DNA-binding response OmpR family regulator